MNSSHVTKSTAEGNHSHRNSLWNGFFSGRIRVNNNIISGFISRKAPQKIQTPVVDQLPPALHDVYLSCKSISNDIFSVCKI